MGAHEAGDPEVKRTPNNLSDTMWIAKNNSTKRINDRVPADNDSAWQMFIDVWIRVESAILDTVFERVREEMR